MTERLLSLYSLIPDFDCVGKCGCSAMQRFLQVGKHREAKVHGVLLLTLLKLGALEQSSGQ